MTKAHIAYLNMGSWPIYVGFTTDPKAYKKEMKRMAVKHPPPFINHGADATCHTYQNGNKVTAIICIRKDHKRDPVQICGLLVHESVHVWQHLREVIGETNPGKETEAYVIQHIAQWCMSQYSTP